MIHDTHKEPKIWVREREAKRASKGVKLDRCKRFSSSSWGWYLDSNFTLTKSSLFSRHSLIDYPRFYPLFQSLKNQTATFYRLGLWMMNWLNWLRLDWLIILTRFLISQPSLEPPCFNQLTPLFLLFVQNPCLTAKWPTWIRSSNLLKSSLWSLQSSKFLSESPMKMPSSRFLRQTSASMTKNRLG